MIHPSTDADFLNRVINHPSVHPWVSLGLKGDLDISALVADPANVFLANEWGGFLLVRKADYVYELHTQFLPAGRGRPALDAGREGCAYMFTRTDCLRMDTYIQIDNVAAKRYARMVGFREWGRVTMYGHPCYYYVLTLKEWARRLDLCQ
jgi:hypothetical protein